MIEEIKNTMRTKMGKVYMYIFLWGNKKKFEEERIRRAIQDENDILKEEFDRRINILKTYLITFLMLGYRAWWYQRPLESKSKVVTLIDISY